MTRLYEILRYNLMIPGIPKSLTCSVLSATENPTRMPIECQNVQSRNVFPRIRAGYKAG